MKVRTRLSIAAAVAAAAVVPLTSAPALAACTTSGTTACNTASVTVAGGGYSVTAAAGSTIAATLGQTVAGTLPSAVWADNSGTGAGWNGTVAVSTLNYTGTWTPVGTPTGTVTPAAGTYTGSADGAQYGVKVTGVSGTTVTFSWTSTDPADKAGGSGATATVLGPAVAVGTKGVSVAFATTPAAGDSWTVNVGNENANALSITGATITPVTGVVSPNPTFVATNPTVLPAGGVGTFGSAVKFLDAAVGQGMGSYTAVPAVKLSLDTNSWAGTYSASVQYTIATGP